MHVTDWRSSWRWSIRITKPLWSSSGGWPHSSSHQPYSSSQPQAVGKSRRTPAGFGPAGSGLKANSNVKSMRLQPAVPAPLFTVPRLGEERCRRPGVITPGRVCSFSLDMEVISRQTLTRRAVRSTIPVLKTRYWQATPPAPLFFSWSVASSPFAAKNSLRDGT